MKSSFWLTMFKAKLKLKCTKSDQYTDYKGKSGKNAKYWTIVDAIEDRIRNKKPDTYASVKPMIDAYGIGTVPGGFDLLDGDTQIGKSPAIVLFIWLLTYIYFSRRPIFVTKRLGTVRDDVMMKFESGFLSDIIQDVCREQGVRADYFKPAFFKYEKDCRMPDHTWRHVPVLLLDAYNYRALVKYYKKVAAEPGVTPVFLVDEVHEMYTNYGSFVRNHGVVSLSARSILHFICNKAQENKCQVLGITATPFRPMVSDPVCFPRTIIQLKSDAPFQGAVYYGYNRALGQLQHIQLAIGNEESVIDTIRQIIARPRAEIAVNAAEGSVEVPFILISTEREKAGQRALVETIRDYYKDDVFVKSLNSGSTDSVNCTSLADFFSQPLLTRSICLNGAVILVSKGCCAASVTIKPSLNTRCIASHDGIQYELFGITDQMVRITSCTSLESIIQLLRLTGWYHQNHTSVLWLPSDAYLHDFEYGIPGSIGAFRAYDGELGPHSLTQLHLPMKRILRVCGGTPEDDPLVCTKRSGVHYAFVDTVPQNAVELNVTIVQTPVDVSVFNQQLVGDHPLLHDFHNHGGSGKGAEQRKLRAQVLSHILHVPHESIYGPYDETRRDELFQAVVCPKIQDTPQRAASRYQVNGIYWGRKGLDTPVTELYAILFDQDWEGRVDAGLAYVDRDENTVNQEKLFYFSDGSGGYIVLSSSKVYSRRDDEMEFFSRQALEGNALSQQHHRVCDEIYTMDTETTARTKCSLCGSPGTNKSTCPCNPNARSPNPSKHPNA